MAHGDGIYKRPDYETYWITYKNADGQRVRENAKTTDRGIAKRIRDERVGRVARGEHLDPRRDQTAYEEAREDLLTYYRVHGTRDLGEAEGRLAHLDPYFSGRGIAKIDAGAIEEYVAHRQKAEAANATINRELATLSKMLRLAHERGKLARVPVVTKTREADPRAGFVTRQEFDSITQHLPVDLRAGALIAFTLGWRKAEVFGLQLRNLDLVTGTVRLDPGTTKNREGRVAHLTPELKVELAAQVARVKALERKLGRVIPDLFPHLSGRHIGLPVADLRKTWARATRKAGKPGVLFHDLRRSAVKGLVAAGVSEKVAMTITGHKTRSVFDRYHIVSEADLVQAAERLAARG